MSSYLTRFAVEGQVSIATIYERFGPVSKESDAWRLLWTQSEDEARAIAARAYNALTDHERLDLAGGAPSVVPLIENGTLDEVQACACILLAVFESARAAVDEDGFRTNHTLQRVFGPAVMGTLAAYLATGEQLPRGRSARPVLVLTDTSNMVAAMRAALSSGTVHLPTLTRS